MKINPKNRISRLAAIDIIKSGKMCSVEFVKRTDNSIRRLNGRCGVKRHLVGPAGSGPSYNAKEHSLIVFYDVIGGGYKSVPTERILSVNGHQVI